MRRPGDELHFLWYILLPEPPRFLQIVPLTKLARSATPWLATFIVQSTFIMVPGLLWFIAGRKTLSVPVLHIHVYPSGNPASAAALLCLFLAVTYASVQYLCAARRHQADLEETALTPEPIIGEAAVMQQKEAWPVDHGQGVPQGDASSLPVDRSMQQPRKPSFKHHSMEDLFRNIHDLKQKLYGSNADVTVKGQRDLATAAAEIDRLCSALGIPATNEHSRTAKSLQEKLEALTAEIG